MCHSRRCVGKIKLFTKPNIRNALFAPLDSKIPRLRVPLLECPNNFLKDPKQFEDVLFAARIVDWKSDDTFAIGLVSSSYDRNERFKSYSIIIFRPHFVHENRYPTFRV